MALLMQYQKIMELQNQMMQQKAAAAGTTLGGSSGKRWKKQRHSIAQ